MRTIGEEQKLSFPVNFQVIEEENINDTRFTKVKVWLLHLGMNESKGIEFSKEVVDRAVPTLKNIPIVSKVKYNFRKGEKDFADHSPIKDRDGNITHGTKPIGVIPETNNPQYETRLCDDYVERTFLTVEGLIWNSRAEEELSILKTTGSKGHSMELSPDMTQYTVNDDDILVPSEIGFDGACILGDHVTPAMKNSTIDMMFSAHDFSSEVQSKLSEYYDNSEKGGKEEMAKEDKTMVCHACGKKRNKEEQEKCECGETKMVTQEKYDEKKDKKKDKKDTDFSEENEDIEDEEEEDVEVEEEDVEEEEEDEIDEEPEDVEEDVEEDVKDEEEDESTISESGRAMMPSDFQAMKEEIAELKAYKQKAELKERKAKEETLFAKYEPLSELEEFKELKKNAHDFSLDELERECALVFANNYQNLDFTDNNNDTNTEEDDTNFDFTQSVRDNKNTKYGGLLDKHFGKND